MKAKLLLFHNVLYLLKRTGEINRVTEESAREFLLNFTDEKYYGGEDALPYKVSNDGDVIAEVDDLGQLIIKNQKVFKEILVNGETKYISTRDFAKIHGKGEVMVRRMCQNGRIPGVIQIGTIYIIPSNAPYPSDNR